MTHINDIIPAPVYETAKSNGYVATRPHPTAPYLIHNYTDKTTWDNAWDEATLTCRGLITTLDGHIVARGYAKFFNSDQPQAPAIPLDDEVVVMDKADGSLGILFPLPEGGHAIATRGSFQSDQAIWATDLYKHRYADTFIPNPDWTYLFEIVFPENRIVVSYGDLRDLILLGAVHTATGATVPLSEASAGWPGLTVEIFPHKTLRDALAAPARDNAEGFVIWHPATDTRVKVKYDQYKFLHRLLTGITPRQVWEILSLGQDPVEVYAAAPDEFHDWLKNIIAGLRADFKAVVDDALELHTDVLTSLQEGPWTRKDYAQAAMRATTGAQAHLRPLLFLILDNRPLDEAVWKLVKPAGDTPLRLVSTDAD